MKEGIFSLPTMNPLTNPKAAPRARQHRRSRKILLVLLNRTIAIPPARTKEDPTDRSMSPVRTIRPCPRAMVPRIELCRRIFVTVVQEVALPLIMRNAAKMITKTTI